jgi:hypothetical protein
MKILSIILLIMARLGSVFWRLKNYGVTETLQYFFFNTLKSRN